MRHRLIALTSAALFAFAPTGCKIVMDEQPGEGELGQAPQTDAERMAAYAEAAWEPKVLPVVAENLVPLGDLRSALDADGLDASGRQYGLRPEGEANPWNFAVSGEGTIVEANTESRAAKLGIDTDGDTATDVTIQLGPVIRGTALRDAMPFIVFTDFRDQIEFAKLANGLNAAANQRLTIPEGDLVGREATFEGVFTLRSATDTPEIVPTNLSIGGTG
jgi:predicted lipoprotein